MTLSFGLLLLAFSAWTLTIAWTIDVLAAMWEGAQLPRV